MIFIDTNYFLRFLLSDVSSQHQEAKALLSKGAKGEVKLFTSLIVMFEIFWVFVASYHKTKPEVIEIMRNVNRLSFIRFEERGIIEEALDIFEVTSLEFEDCYNWAYARKHNMTEYASFDKKLVKVIRASEGDA